jgi:hypothetical protein
MILANVSLKDYLIIGSLTGFLRMTSTQITGYKQSDFTYWGSYGTWTLSSIVAILVYAITMWLLGSSAKIDTSVETGEVAGSSHVEGRTAAQK